MLIPYFLHFMNEAFVADVDDADKSKNTLDIELPGKDQRRKFELKDGEAFEITEDNPEGIEIEDLKLRKFVLQAIRGIKNIKEQERALELERISGGDSNVIKTIEKLYDTNDEEHIIRVNTKSSENDGTPDMYSLWEEIKDLKPYEYKYISLKELSEKQKECFTLASEHFVGKGEYFLPIIFTDVYKKKSHGYEDDDVTFTKGDNLILKPDGTFDEINLRSAGCPLKFESYREVPDKYSKKEDVEKAFKDAVVGSITKYIYTYSKGKNVYLVIFDNKFKNSYKENMGKDLDGFFIFCAGRTVGRLGKDISIKKEEGYKNIFDALFDKIEISDEFYFLSSKTYDAYISYSGGENGKIVIYLDRKYCEEYNYENDSDKEKKRLDAKELLKQGYTQREVTKMTGVAHAIVSKLRKELENDGFTFDKKPQVKGGLGNKIKELRNKIKEIESSISTDKTEIKEITDSLSTSGTLSEDEKDKIIKKIEGDKNTFEESIKGKKIKKGELNDLRNALIINIVTYLVIEGFSKNEIKEFVKVSTNLINKVIKTVQESKEVEIKEHPSIRGKKSRLVELKKDIESLTDIVESFKKEIEEIREETKNTLMSLSEEGKNAEQIGKEMGESSQTIRNWCEKYGITLKKSAQGRPKKTKVEERHYIISFSEMFENKKGLD